MGKHSTNPTPKGSGGKHVKAGQAERDTQQIRHATRAASAATSTRTRGGKPSVIGHTASGAAKGTAIGAAVGSVVPGLGTAVGAGVGAGAGAVGGSRAKGDYRRAQRSPGQRALVAEFIACVVILALSPLTDKHHTDTPGAWMKRATGVCALFIVLGLIGAAGPRAGKAAAGFGGLVLVTLLVTDRDVFAVVAKRFGAPPASGPAGPGSPQGPAGPGDRPLQFDTQPGVPDPGSAPSTLPGSPTQPGRRGPRFL